MYSLAISYKIGRAIAQNLRKKCVIWDHRCSKVTKKLKENERNVRKKRERERGVLKRVPRWSPVANGRFRGDASLGSGLFRKASEHRADELVVAEAGGQPVDLALEADAAGVLILEVDCMELSAGIYGQNT
jgi:hypothetical protein